MSDVDVLIVGAGLSGIGAAWHLKTTCPTKSFAILEGREAIGGTWDLFRYPGVRSDSDMYTLGYRFRPWQGATSIADGPSILDYVKDTAREHDLERAIRFGHRIERAEWSSVEATWTVSGTASDGPFEITCSFLYFCTGYYDYDRGYAPEFPGRASYQGTVVHPQHWPEDLDHTGKRVVIIGSGATAVTLVPALALTAEHVTMLQRSPSFVVSPPARDPMADRVKRFKPSTAYGVIRWRNVLFGVASYRLTRLLPERTAKLLVDRVTKALPEGYDVERHFTPTYKPWDQRVCLVPDGDLFTAISSSKASVVTDTIASFTPTGLRLTSGEELVADIVVTATGLNLMALGGASLMMDGEPVEVGDALTYKGMMLSGIPNLAMAIGYTNASWTLKVDLISGYVCRLLNYLDEHGYATCTPTPEASMRGTLPFLNLTSGYVQRSLALWPKQGSRAPWQLNQSYLRDLRAMRFNRLDDGSMRFGRRVRQPLRETV